MSGIGNSVPTALSSVIESYPPAFDKLELIDLLVTGKTGTYRETFFQKIQSILNRTPRIGTSVKPEFFTYKMIGTLTALPYTKLMERLHIQQIYIKPVKSPKGIFTVKAALQLETEGKKALQLYTFSATDKIRQAQNWKMDELEELISQLKITKDSLSSYEVSKELQVSGKIYCTDHNFELQEKDIKIMSSGPDEDLKEIFRKLVQEHPLGKNKVFKEVTRVVGLKDAKGSNVENLEFYFKRLSSYCANLEEIDDAHKEDSLRAVAQQVAEAASDIIQEGLSPIYTYWKKELELGKNEVCSHAYVVGVLENLFKYRYALDIAVERNLGQGRADLTFVSRLDGSINKNWEGVLVGVEFKGGEVTTPKDALKQMVEQKYLRISRMRSSFTWGAELGVNMNLKEPVKFQTTKVEVIPINFIKTLLNLGDLAIANLHHSVIAPNIQTIDNDVLQKLKEGLADIDYSIVRQNGSPDNSDYFKNFLLGQAMGFTESGYSTYAIFEESNPNLSLFFVKENGVVILSINKASTPSDHEDKVDFLKKKGFYRKIALTLR